MKMIMRQQTFRERFQWLRRNAWQCGLWLVLLSSVPFANATPPPTMAAEHLHRYQASGVVQAINRDLRQIVIHHEAIADYMGAMTMPFQVKNLNELAHLERGDAITFQLHVTATESWVEQLTKTGTVSLPPANPPAAPPAPHPLRDYHFTNELGQAVSLNDFRGQAVAITFFYTRCPLPDYCPRLSKNFQEASQELAATTNAPANWHFISITFDPANDTPEMLKAYGQSYRYDPNHWSFLTGPPDKIAQLARECGVEYTPNDGAINHNFRTLIVDAAGHLQMVYPITGDLSGSIVEQMLKAAAVKPEMTKP